MFFFFSKQSGPPRKLIAGAPVQRLAPDDGLYSVRRPGDLDRVIKNMFFAINLKGAHYFPFSFTRRPGVTLSKRFVWFAA